MKLYPRKWTHWTCELYPKMDTGEQAEPDKLDVFRCLHHSFISMNCPIFSAASSCIFRVTWV